MPIYTSEQLAKVGTGETAYSAETGKVYTFSDDKTYMFYGESEDISDVIKNIVSDAVNEKVASMYPVGSIYTSKNNQNPGEFIEGTTWKLVGKNVIDTGWQSFSWTNSTYIGVSTQSSYTQNKWRVKDNILYIQVGAGAASTINISSEDELARIPIKGNTSFNTSDKRIWNGAVGGGGAYGGMVVRQNASYISVNLKPHVSSAGHSATWFSTHFTIPLDNDFTFTSGSYETEYKWERVS